MDNQAVQSPGQTIGRNQSKFPRNPSRNGISFFHQSASNDYPNQNIPSRVQHDLHRCRVHLGRSIFNSELCQRNLACELENLDDQSRVEFDRGNHAASLRLIKTYAHVRREMVRVAIDLGGMRNQLARLVEAERGQPQPSPQLPLLSGQLVYPASGYPPCRCEYLSMESSHHFNYCYYYYHRPVSTWYRGYLPWQSPVIPPIPPTPRPRYSILASVCPRHSEVPQPRSSNMDDGRHAAPTVQTHQVFVDAAESRHSTNGRKPRAQRRPIEGDCPICYLPLLDENREDEKVRATNVDAGKDSSCAEGLVWCKAQCGHNFHVNCIKTWHRMKQRDRFPAEEEEEEEEYEEDHDSEWDDGYDNDDEEEEEEEEGRGEDDEDDDEDELDDQALGLTLICPFCRAPWRR